MRNNYYDDRYDRRSRRGNDRWNEPETYRSRNDWEENLHNYYGGRDRMDMDSDRDTNERTNYDNGRSYGSWSDSGRRYDNYRRNDDGRYSSSRNGNRYEDENDNYTGRSQGFNRYGGTGRGWYGDYEGHAAAAERGWENRRGEHGYGSGNRYDDDERRTNSGRGRGWYGENSRHSDASERGWDNRR